MALASCSGTRDKRADMQGVFPSMSDGKARTQADG